MYHFSAPSDVSRNPSDELSDPLRPLLCSGVKAPVPGDVDVGEYGDVEWWWCCREVWKWPACIATEVAPVVAPAFVVMALACVAAGIEFELLDDVVEAVLFCVE